MQRFINAGRLTFIFVIMAIILIIYDAKLYSLQVYDDGIDDEVANATTQYKTLTAARGDLLDRNGVLLASSTASYNVLLSRSDLLDMENTNEVILDYIYTAVENGVEYNDTLPITSAAPFNYVANMSAQQRTVLDAYFDFFDLDPEISASDLITWLKEHYGIDYSVSLSEARPIMGIRYELETRVIVNIDPYVFVETASSDFISILYERGFEGFTVETDVERKYFTDSAPHLLGYIGDMNPEQYEVYKELDYPMDAEVGQTGLEAAFEEYLHGVDGREKLTVGESGAVINSETVTEVAPGANVYSSIDIKLQEVAEDALAEKIEEINLTREEGDKAEAGAVAAVEVGTGEILAAATYPLFNIETFFEDYTELSNDPASPLLDRSTMGLYNPGSTFKPVVAYAGLKSGKIDENTTVYDGGRYTEYAPSYAPYCWIYKGTGGGHGSLNVIGALENSCNVFFWWVGDHIGLDAITRAAAEFGLGEETGIETGEYIGYAPTVEKKKELTGGTPWYAADTLLAAIGQGYNMYTPIQLANYAATIASGGTRYELTLMHSVKSADYTRVLEVAEPVVAHELESPEYIDIIKRGMEAVATDGTAAEEFSGFRVNVACKTGTVQSDDDVSNTGVFICYAPAEDPEIAVSVVIEKGTSGATVIEVAKSVLEYYFTQEVGEVELVFNNSLVQ